MEEEVDMQEETTDEPQTAAPAEDSGGGILLKLILGIVLALALVWTAFMYWPSSSSNEFSFAITETGEMLPGTIYFGDIEYAKVENGVYSFDDFDDLPANSFEFRTKRGDKDFAFKFSVPEDTSAKEYNFTIPLANFTQQYEYFNNTGVEDDFTRIKELHFPKLPITYSLDILTERGSDWYEKDRVEWALGILENETNHVLEFEEVSKYANPMITIKGSISDYASPDRFKEGESKVEEKLAPNIIKNSVVNYHPLEYDGDYLWNYGKCGSYPLIEIHGILHALGFEHMDTKDSIMFPLDEVSIGCRMNQTSKDVIECLKYIYSNGAKGEGCKNVNIFPVEYEPVYEEDTFEDFAWSKLPINLSIKECDPALVDKFENVINMFEKAAGGDLFTLVSEKAQAVIHCRGFREYSGLSFNLETDYWSLTGHPAIHKVYKFTDDKISSANIYIFQPERCTNTTSSALEKIALFRAIGLRNDYGDDVRMLSRPEDCEWGIQFSSSVIKKLKELYPRLKS